MQKKLGTGNSGKGDVEAHMESIAPKSRMRQARASKPIQGVFMSPKDASVRSKIAAAKLAGAFHTDQHVLSCHPLAAMKLSQGAFPDSEVETQIPRGQTKGEF